MFNSPYFRNRMARFTRRHPAAVANRSDATPRPDVSVASVHDFTERSRRTLENTKKLEEEWRKKREELRERGRYLNKTMFYLDLKLAEDEQPLIELFTDTAKKQLEGDIKLNKEKVKTTVRNRKDRLEKEKAGIWTKKVAVAYGKLLTAIDPMTSRIARLASGAPEGGRRKTKRRKTRKRKKIKRRKKTRKKMKTRKKTKRRRKRIKKKN